jgi:carbonic anhydrase/acetyltransferase-like protein (isoleucine patch superfamily)
MQNYVPSNEFRVADDLIVFPGAVICGDVRFGRGCSVWFNAVMRTASPIVTGDNCNIQDNCVFHTAGLPTVLGDNVTVGHGAIVHGATIGKNCLIGMGAIVLDGAVVPDGCFVAAGALVTKALRAEPGSMIMGSPAKAVRPLREDETAEIASAAERYRRESRRLAGEAGLALTE